MGSGDAEESSSDILETQTSHTDDAQVAPDSSQTSLIQDVPRLDRLTEWIFAALSFLELPLMDDIQFQLQQLRRTCLKLLAAARGSAPEGIASSDAALARVSLLLVIVTQVFGQR